MSSVPSPSAASVPPRRSGWPAALLLAGVFACVAIPFILIGFDRGRGAFDDINYHAKVIGTFAYQWPSPDFTDYLSMTTPGYHLALAAVSCLVTDARDVVQGAGMLFTLALLVLLARGASARAGGASTAWTLAACLPVICSLYVFNSGVWLLPDNAAWLGVLGVLLIALRSKVDAWTAVGGGLVLLALVFIRQVHVWAAAPLWVAAWLGSQQGARSPKLMGEPTFGASFARAIGCFACTLPAFLLVAYFARMWQGLCPPSFAEWVKPPGRPTPYSPAAGAFILSLFAIASCFYIAHLAPGFVRLWRGARWVIPVAGLAGLLLGLVPPTSFSPPDGRYSGLWPLARIMPIADRSPVIGALSALGGVLLAAWCASVSLRDRLILLAALAGFAATQTVNPWVWQRYIEPFILIMMVLWASSAAGESRRTTGADLPLHWRTRLAPLGIVGPLALAGLLAANTVRELVTATPVPDLGFASHTAPGEPGHVEGPPLHPQSDPDVLKPGSPNPDN